jgi:uncharacterized alpha-E superfamily protein
MALTRDAKDASDEWRSVIVTLGLQELGKFGTEYTGPHVFNFVLRDKENPATSC